MLTTADGVPLAKSLERANRKRKHWAFMLVLPLLLFLMINFVFPIFDMMIRSVQNDEVHNALPKTIQLLEDWDETSDQLPSEAVFNTFSEEMKLGQEQKIIGDVGKRLNYEKSGMSSLFRKTARKSKRWDGPIGSEEFIKIDRDWGDVVTWRLIKREGSPYTKSHLLNAIDMEYSDEGDVQFKPEKQRLHLSLLWKTIWISLLITGLTILLAYPISFLMAHLPDNKANILMILVLLPFWTSLLVRTTAWIVILQTEGVLNDLLVLFGIVDDGNRIQMIYNMTGTVIAMTHILLPFMVLPLYSVMKTIPESYVRAAKSLGATPWTAFWRVYVPQTITGIGAGSILVFILAVGYYITPALVGGSDGLLISNTIAYHMQSSLNWGLAAAIGAILLLLVLAIYMLYNRLVGIDNMKLG